MRLARYPLALLLVGAFALGCSEDEPTAEAEVSDEDRYCEAYRDFFHERAAQGASTSDAEVVKTLKAWGATLEEIDPPADMPEDAKGGHAIWADLISQIEDDANQDDVVALESELDASQVEQVEAFMAYNDSTCLS